MNRAKYYEEKIRLDLFDNTVLDIQVSQFGKVLTVYFIYYRNEKEREKYKKWQYYKITYKGVRQLTYQTDVNGEFLGYTNEPPYKRPYYLRDIDHELNFFSGITITELKNGLLKVVERSWFQTDIICEDIDIEIGDVKKDGTFFWESHPNKQYYFE